MGLAKFSLCLFQSLDSGHLLGISLGNSPSPVFALSCAQWQRLIAFPAGSPVVAAFPGSLAATFPVLEHFQQLGHFPSRRSYFWVCFHCATSPKTLCPLNSASLSNPQVSPSHFFLFLHFFTLWPHHLFYLHCPSSSLLPQATKLMLV